MKRWKWRLMWLSMLLLLWLFCSGVAQAGTLIDRLAQFPDWQGKPSVQTAQGDLIYPDWFAGDWQVTTTLVDMVAPLAPEVITPGFESNRQFLNQPIAFPVRFVATKPETRSALLPLSLKIQPESPSQSHKSKIVSDRAFNGASLAKAYLGDRSVLAVKVDPDNPNRQITLLRGDRQLASTVTARATETPNANQFITTEIFQQEFLGAPQVYFNEVENTTAYTRNSSLLDDSVDSSDTPMITADQITAIYLSPQDPDYFKTTQNNPIGEPLPVALYRYQMEFRPKFAAEVSLSRMPTRAIS